VENTTNRDKQPLDRRAVLTSIGERGIVAGINGRAAVADSSESAVAATAEEYLQADTVADLGVAASSNPASVSSNTLSAAEPDMSETMQIGGELAGEMSAGTGQPAFDAATVTSKRTPSQTLNPVQQFQVKLYHELARRGLVRNTDIVETVFTVGESEYQRLRSIAGEDWEAVLTTAGPALTERDAVRIAGYGRILAEFLISPLDMPDEARETVLELGATMNLWVATFDRLLDSGTSPDDISSSYGVRAAFTRNSVVDRAYERLVPPDRRAIYRLLSAYAHTIDDLPHADARRHIRQDINDCFSEMHQKGRELWYRPWSAEADKITSVNAIAILGLPGWLATSSYSGSRYQRHVDWMEGVGWLFGLIDDTADLSEDATTGSNNSIQTQLETNSDRVVIERIADRAERLFTELDEMTTHTDCELPPEDVFRGTINSWLTPGSV